MHVLLYRSVGYTNHQRWPSFEARYLRHWQWPRCTASHLYLWQWPGFPVNSSCHHRMSQSMAEAFFATDFLSSLRDSTDPRHPGLFSILRDELPASIRSEAQISLPTAFDKPAKSVCDALRWLTACGKIVHIASISKTLTPYGMLLTAAADIHIDMEKTSLDYGPLAVMRSPALLYNVQQQPVDIQRLVHQWDPT